MLPSTLHDEVDVFGVDWTGERPRVVAPDDWPVGGDLYGGASFVTIAGVNRAFPPTAFNGGG
eukprot:5239594-Prorocentrum_lima.AAC.1